MTTDDEAALRDFTEWWKVAKTQPPYSNPEAIAKSAWLASRAEWQRERAEPVALEPAPCDCILYLSGNAYPDCDCQNNGDLMRTQDWCTRHNLQRAAPPPAPEPDAQNERGWKR